MAKAIQLLDNSLLSMLDITALVWQGNPSEEQKLKIILGKLNSQPAVCSSGSKLCDKRCITLYYSYIKEQDVWYHQTVFSVFFIGKSDPDTSQTHVVPRMGQNLEAQQFTKSLS